MDSILLPLAESPLKCYKHHVFPLSILANNSCYLPWFYSNFIQIECHWQGKNSNSVPFVCFFDTIMAVRRNPFLKTQILSWEVLVNTNSDFIKFISDQISLGYYIYCFIDEYFIPNRNAYQKYNSISETLICGYDKNKRNISIYGYDNTNNLKIDEVNYSTIETAFYSNVNNIRSIEYWQDPIYLLKYDGSCLGKFDLTNLNIFMSDYLESKNSYFRISDNDVPPNSLDMVYGLSVYDEVKKYINNIQKRQIDIRAFYLLLDHKRTMSSRLKYISEAFHNERVYYIYERYCYIESLMYNICQLVNKYNLILNGTILSRIHNSIEEMINLEKDLLTEALFQLKHIEAEGF